MLLLHCELPLIRLHMNLKWSFMVFLLFLVMSKSQVCSSTSLVGNSSLNCLYDYEHPCNNASELTFLSCSFDSCSKSFINTCISASHYNSSDFTWCESQCNSNQTSSSVESQWISVVVAIVCSVLLLLICICLAKSCCRNVAAYQHREDFPQNYEHESNRQFAANSQPQPEPAWAECPQLWEAEQETCVICLDKDLNCCLPCHHYYHIICIKQWLRRETFCPTCKAESNHITILCKICKKQQVSYSIPQFILQQAIEQCSNCPQMPFNLNNSSQLPGQLPI